MNQAMMNQEIPKTKKISYQEIATPIVIGVFFCFLCFFFGIGQYPDSVTYIEGKLDREPLYPLLLQGFRAVFGTGYLWAVIIVQNVAAALVTWYLHHYVCRKFGLNAFFSRAVLVVLLFPHVMSGVFTPSGIVLTNAILSEGITLTLYQLFFVYVLKMWLEKKCVRYIAAAVVTAFVTTLARGQMMTMILLWMLFAGIVLWKRARGGWQKTGAIAVVLLVTVGVFAGRGAIIEGYNAARFGVHNGNTGGNMTLLTNVLYSADEEDVECVAQRLNHEEAELLKQMYAQMQEQGLTYAAAKDGVVAHILHHEDSHDLTKFGILYPAMQDYIKAQNPQESDAVVRVKMDELAGEMMLPLVLENVEGFLWTYLYVICGGFIRTVAILHPLLGVYALLIYIVAIGLMWYLFRRGRSYDAAGLTALVLVMIAANVCATGLTIMCLSRYMIYNMAIFYMTGLVLLQTIWNLRKK